ncbi:MAG: hypothetical protein H6Q13_1161 [Bacteroidetes bacterium]|jgi:hypothetical protein|nr:hypothetical protein [Bacteroidota bacterium]
MLSPEVIRAIEILKGINYSLNDAENKTLRPLLDISSQCLLEKLRKSDLIRLRSGKHDTLILSSYELCHPLDQISLCDILIITGEGFKISIENAEDIYTRYGVVGRRLGILNQLACYYLSQIHLTDMCLEK